MSQQNSDISRARAHFPRGLEQPAGAFRFALDALLLAAFASRLRPGWRRLADLGCGVGPVALGALLLAGDDSDGREAWGLEKEPELLRAASGNAQRLGFAGRFRPLAADFMDFQAGELAGSFDLVTANPPYRLPGAGRQPAARLRREALFAGPENLGAFIRAGSRLLSPDGLFCLVFSGARADELADTLREAGLAVTAAVPLLSRPGAAAEITLLAAQAGGSAVAWREAAPLALYEPNGRGGERISAAALDFCPFLACNAKG